MNSRQFVLYIYLLAFFLALAAVLGIPAEAWKYLDLWQQFLMGFYILVGVCGILIAYWVYTDGKTLSEMEVRLNARIDYLRKQLAEVEKQKTK